jgi:hypothetical protein
LIHYLCSQKHSYPLGSFLEAWAQDMAHRFRQISYESLASGPPERREGVYIFADLERLTPRGLEVAVAFRNSLRALGDRARVLNDPTRALRRYDLLRTLYDGWINSFDAYRVTEARRPRSLPVFLRREFDHGGPIAPLLATSEQLDVAIARLKAQGDSAEELEGTIIVEFRDTADAGGLYRKYGAFNIDGRIFPRHLLFSRNWCVKEPDLVGPEHVEEELRYAGSFPHAGEIRRIFQIARIDYGRIDYSFYDGRLQVWEINTNPLLVTREMAEPGAPRHELHYGFAGMVREAFLALDAP